LIGSRFVRPERPYSLRSVTSVRPSGALRPRFVMMFSTPAAASDP
jgi:hypothetical protein